MADKTLNIRIKSKYDTLANWTANKSKVLLAGEVGFCYVPALTSDTITTAPIVLFKVGDGITPWGNLPWGAGLGADVPAWAKAPTKPSYTLDEIGVNTNADYVIFDCGSSTVNI